MNKKITLTTLIFILVLIGSKLHGQRVSEAVLYLETISEEYEDIRKETWDYTSTMAHSRSARKVERKRTDLLKTLKKAKNTVKKMKSFEGDYSLRDSVVAFLSLNYNVLNDDFSEIIDMEAVAEESYDAMEAYLLAQELANEKLEKASESLDVQYEAFASKYGVTLVENRDKISMKLKQSSEALKYYNQVYLIFFKAYKQEVYLIDALDRNDIGAIEQNRNALLSISNEGIVKLDGVGHFKGDRSVSVACNRMLDFYIDEAEDKIPVITDFLLLSEEYNKMVQLLESKDRMLVTQEEIERYNKAVESYKKGINNFNNTNKRLNTVRSQNLDRWNNSVSNYMARHIPKR